MRGKIIFILGGARSGKSEFACKLVKKEKNVIFIATAEANDSEMEEKIKKHKRQRPQHWITCEEPVDADVCLQKYNDCKNTIIVDCLTLWVSNILMKYKCKPARKKIKSFMDVLNSMRCDVIIVSNEVGMGIVPDNFISRLYRDILGELNLNVAKIADEVYYLIAGVPLKIK